MAASHAASLDPQLAKEESKQRHPSTTSILVATDAEYPPMEYISGTQVVGHDIDLMNVITTEMNVSADYIIVPWAGIFDGLVAGDYDAIIDTLTVTPEREEIVDFTLPYMHLAGYNEDIAIALQQGDEILRDKMNEALGQLHADGTLENIIMAIAIDKPEWEPQLPNWTSCSIPSDLESTLIFTDAQGLSTTIYASPNSVSETTTLIYTPIVTATEPSGFAFAGHGFSLEAYQDGSHQPSFILYNPVTVTIHYSDEDVFFINEDSLKLEYWDGSQWVDAATTCTPISIYTFNTDMNWLAVPICHLSKFALFGETSRIYLTVIVH
jgi:hypothetical protein